MKKLYLLLISIAGFGSLHAQTLMTVDPATEYQTIIGLGGGNGTKSNANFIKYVVDYLGITVYRQWLQTKDDVTISQINSGTLTFSIFDAAGIAYLQTMTGKGVKVIGAVLSPPACLKKNNCLSQRAQAVVGGPWICGQACATPMCPNGYNSSDPDNLLLPEYYDEYARYLALYAKEFKAQIGVDLYALSIQNEPLFNEPYGSAKLFSFAYGPALQAVYDTFAKYPGLSDILFYGPEHMCTYSGNNGGQGVGSNYIKSLLDTATYRPYLDAYAVHGYSDGIAPDLGSSAEWETFAAKVVGTYGKMMWMSETSSKDNAQWANAYWYMKGLFMGLKSGKVSLWSYNSLEWFYEAGNSTRELFSHMHFYRFIRPGAKMIKVTDTDPDVETIGFKKGSDITLVVINIDTKNPKTIQFSDFAAKPVFFHVYRSTSSEMCAYAGKVTDNTFVLPAESVVTITYDATNPNTTFGPLAPTNLTATKISDNSITVTWTAASSWTLNGSPVTISGYIVYINGVKKTLTPTSATTYTFNSLTKGTVYNIQVYTRDAMINQSVASTLSVTTTCDAGGCVPIIGMEEEQAVLSVLPNPASNMVTVEMPDNSIYNLVIIDITGKIVLTKQNVRGRETIDISALPKGIYIVLANSDEKIFKAKIAVE